MVQKKTIRLVCAIFTFPSWYFYYSFLHGIVRSCDICLNGDKFSNSFIILVLDDITSKFKKVIYLIIMYCCGFSIINCVLCVMGCIHCFKDPCQVKFTHFN